MAAAGLQSTDVLHYESRAIRAGLKASINRLASAKGYIPSSLTPEELRQHGVPQDWSAPKVIVDFEEVRAWAVCMGRQRMGFTPKGILLGAIQRGGRLPAKACAYM